YASNFYKFAGIINLIYQTKLRNFILFLFLTSLGISYSQNNISNLSVKDTVSFKNIKPSLTISKCGNNSVNLDGKLDEPFWKSCCCAKNFVEIDPGDNTMPTVQTEAYFTYDDDNLYV